MHAQKFGHWGKHTQDLHLHNTKCAYEVKQLFTEVSRTYNLRK